MYEDHAEASDEELARRARSGDRASFETLVVRYGPRMAAFLRSVTSAESDVADLAQQGFVRAYQQLAKYDPERPFRPWLFTVARRVALDHAKKRQTETGTPAESEPVDRRDPAHLLAKRETTELLWAWTRRQLTEPQFTAFWLRVEEECSVKEIATAMKIGTAHARVLLFRARQRLARALSAAGIGEPAGANVGGHGRSEAPALLREARRRKEWCL